MVLRRCLLLLVVVMPVRATTCGAKSRSTVEAASGRIVGGQNAAKCEWKWQVSLSDGGFHFCGGTLIAPNWVLTAAHCMGGSFDVVAGSWRQYRTDSEQVTLAVKRVIPHPLYNAQDDSHDFALVELEDAAPLNDCIGVACLPTEDVAVGEECFITGWGTLSSGGNSPNKLQEAQVTIYSNADCDSAYSNFGWTITDDMLCAQGTNNQGENTDACQGDSGGPLVCDSGSGVYVLHGATSWGYGCAVSGYPGVWSRVNYVRDWIDNEMLGAPTPAPLAVCSNGGGWGRRRRSCGPLCGGGGRRRSSCVLGPVAAPTPAPAPLTCGAKSRSTVEAASGRIVGGQNAAKCEWKWQVSLSDGGFHFCGGTLIAPNWVLTAAHCMGGSFDVVAGSWRQYRTDSEQVTLAVKRVIPHPLYNAQDDSHDFALVELEDAAPLNDCIGVACLPTEDVAVGEECFITGWGTLSSGGNSPNKLQEAQVTIYSNADCDSAYSNFGWTITDDMLCAQGTNNQGENTDACQGDSGGPLVCDSGSGVYVLHGATSWGYGCAVSGYPGVWSRVNYVRDWIDNEMFGRRLVNGSDSQADDLDWNDELAVVPEVRQVSNVGTDLFYA
ncbi:unnamed protein product [Prorocentrum cordatum]|uniref:Peptidase S1 domain-containing protein n=1 Tax=Prorocentrum cordatum TaxID=2364126 RepID=A0ABN9QZX1_9DINO|nr:unnamed protein product [Polarella glacialis]